ncbi:syntaxin-like protein psy1 [Podospora appendiculata]|uniref:Syntaxin-like protein psy1 n=1 Tax=Podospora appendiculata TaxID=314037 RepID=A0AAE0WZI5_9PEZI|nr:syntaxin-like protein psy1 [Podospora appendiculata]
MASHGQSYESYEQRNGWSPAYGAPPSDQELQPYPLPSSSSSSSGVPLSTTDFLTAVQQTRNEITSITADVQQIALLHQRALDGSNNNAEGIRALDGLAAAAQAKNARIREQLRALKTDAGLRRAGSGAGAGFSKESHVLSLGEEFKRELRAYLEEERRFRELYRLQIARQYRIVNPGASEAEVALAVERDWGDEGVFQSALRNSHRAAQASTVLGAVRARHNELQKVEQSIAELAALFQDLETLLLQQGELVKDIEAQTEGANENLNKGNKEVHGAVKSAQRARRLRQYCLLVTILIVLILALVLGLFFGLRK